MPYVFTPPSIDRVSTSSESVLCVPDPVAAENCSDKPGTLQSHEMFPTCSSCSIASWKALGVEIKMHSPEHGIFWLVSSYTGQDRVELTPEDFPKQYQLLEAFPGSRVVAFGPLAVATGNERGRVSY